MTEEIKKKGHKEEKPLEKMTVKELRAIAMEIPRATSVHDMKKDELIAVIKEARGISDEVPGKKIKDSSKLITKQAMKARIKHYKEERDVAVEKKNKKKVQFLRRRISRLKKQTRRIVAI